MTNTIQIKYNKFFIYLIFIFLFGLTLIINLSKHIDSISFIFLNVGLITLRSAFLKLSKKIEITKETINKFSQDLLSKMSVSLVNDCDVYYKFMDTSRNSIYRDINKDSVKKSIQHMNNMKSENKDKSFFIKRGEMYFEISDLRGALANFNSALKLDSNSVLANYFKAWILERKGNYEEAYNICNKLTLLSDKVKYKILAAILKRKKDGL